MGKVVVSVPQPSAPSLRAAASSSLSSGSILITGGTGALGLLIASWLVRQQGGRQIVLASRSGRNQQGSGANSAAPSPSQRQLQVLLAADVTVTIVAADTAAAADRAGVIEGIRAAAAGGAGCVAGVIHAAGVLEDAALRKQNLASLRR